MAKNILDYSIAKKINKNISDANSHKNETIRALKEKNEKKLDEWHRRA
jgi:DNA-binding CsgD family transcriptional regulator|tara:strand:- start:341 stop:484 length:144 start_codon:yes stop_codon:yes gene_type:complete